MSFLDNLKNENNLTFTENGAVALSSTMNACLDAFGSLGAMKSFNESAILDTFKKAFAEDRKLAMKILFYMRDVRGGQGMRRVFRIIVTYLANNHPEFVENNFKNFAEYGRWDDFLCLLDTDLKENVLSYIKAQLLEDVCNWYDNKPVSLLAKWLPSENASSQKTIETAKTIRKYLEWTPRSYRKTLSKLRNYLNVVEVKMSSNEWNKIDYASVPGKASLNYSDAFTKHDEERYINFLVNTSSLNANALFPVDIIHKALEAANSRKCSKKDRILYNKMWESLPNYLEGHDETGICMVDTSGSMYGTPYEVALSLGIYCADKCKGPFKNHFITFSENPELVSLQGADLVEKISNIRCINAGNTNFEAALDLILDTAVKYGTPKEELPSKLYVISDMQFDEAKSDRYIDGWKIKNKPLQPFMEEMRRKYEAHGYKLPSIVYWNVRASECGMFQQKFDGEDCAMVSGYSASLFKSIIEGTTYEEVVSEDGKSTKREKIDPLTVMLTTLNNPRYDKVWVG